MISNRLKEQRTTRNLTQQELSITSKVGRQTISDIENGKHMPSVFVALRLAKAIGVSVEDIFYLT